MTTPSAAIDGLPDALRSRLALALDTDDFVEAERLIKELSPWFGVVKVGMELYAAGGPEGVAVLVDQGLDVFLDLKLHDIPTTVGKTARVLGSIGVRYLTMHAFGGVAMLQAAVEGLAEGAAATDMAPPIALAVTVLTSDGTAPPHILGKRVEAALAAGCGGIVCSASDVAEAKTLGPQLTAVVPGIRAASGSRDDQANPATPEAAFAAGADVLVVGRAVTAASDRQAAAASLFASLL